ncbi:MAG: recombinase family protein, partial [Anaeroplasmataceae bacterium]|nr:recombinase family protein [Anaeroplasmataceae bacterium]
MIERIGIYVRLSQEDMGKNLRTSIENQIEYIKNYLFEKNLNFEKIYIDDGFSGRNFDRPDFIQLLKDIDSKQINCVIVKDLSRLGRNYLTVGKYIEEIFPNKQVRFISINDNYDSLNGNHNFIELRNYLNHLYLKDCEKKSRQQIKRRCQSGNMSLLGQYGYRKDENKQLIIDMEAAKIVQRIYMEFNGGMSTTQIAKQLTKEKIINPGYYRYLRLGKSSAMEHIVTKAGYNPYHWSVATIKKILSDEEYTGISINRPYSRERSKKMKRVSPYRIENTQEAIISKEVYEAAKKKRNDYAKKIKKTSYKRLVSKVYCSLCNKLCRFALQFYSNANGKKDISTYTCPICKNKISAKLLHEILFNDAKEVILNIRKEKFLKNREEKEFQSNHITLKQGIIDKKSLEIEYEILLDKKITKSITDEEYQTQLKKLSEISTNLEVQLHPVIDSKLDNYNDK